MDRHYEFSDSQMADFKRDRLFRNAYKDYLFCLMQCQRGFYGTAVGESDLESMKVSLRIYYDILLDIDEARTLSEVPLLSDF